MFTANNMLESLCQLYNIMVSSYCRVATKFHWCMSHYHEQIQVLEAIYFRQCHTSLWIQWMKKADFSVQKLNCTHYPFYSDLLSASAYFMLFPTPTARDTHSSQPVTAAQNFPLYFHILWYNNMTKYVNNTGSFEAALPQVMQPTVCLYCHQELGIPLCYFHILWCFCNTIYRNNMDNSWF